MSLTDLLVAWALFTTLLGLMAVAGWIRCENGKQG